MNEVVQNLIERLFRESDDDYGHDEPTRGMLYAAAKFIEGYAQEQDARARPGMTMIEGAYTLAVLHPTEAQGFAVSLSLAAGALALASIKDSKFIARTVQALAADYPDLVGGELARAKDCKLKMLARAGALIALEIERICKVAESRGVHGPFPVKEDMNPKEPLTNSDPGDEQPE